ncbi:MAG: hypothetical protein WCP29_11905 [Acidobacteriota bacterium]
MTWRWVGWLLARLLMDAALIDAGVETWMSGSPSRWWVCAPIALYVLFSLWALQQGARLAAPGIVTQTPAPFYVFLGILVAMTQDRSGLGAGVVMFKHPMPAVLTATAAAMAMIATARMAFSRGRSWLPRIVLLAIGTYATGALVWGAMHGTPLPELLRGQSEWRRAPYWLQGAYLGAVALPSVAFAREVMLSMKVVKLRGYFRWMVVFFLGAWLAINAL